MSKVYVVHNSTDSWTGGIEVFGVFETQEQALNFLELEKDVNIKLFSALSSGEDLSLTKLFELGLIEELESIGRDSIDLDGLASWEAQNIIDEHFPYCITATKFYKEEK